MKLPWQPSQGDLIIHAAEIWRGAQRIDLVKGGQPFTVLRRETDLDQRMLDGVLTATMAAEGLAVGDVLPIDAGLAERADQSDLPNQRCWTHGIGNLALDKGLKDCTRAIELGSNAAAALDSRVTIYHRLGRYEEALADLTAALDSTPDLSPSLFMRGVVLNRLGRQKEGADFPARARLIDPQVERTHARYNIAP